MRPTRGTGLLAKERESRQDLMSGAAWGGNYEEEGSTPTPHCGVLRDSAERGEMQVKPKEESVLIRHTRPFARIGLRKRVLRTLLSYYLAPVR